MGKIIVFTNVKGGVGKTLMCSYFASYLTQKGRRVAVVDADIQQSLSDHREDDLQKLENFADSVRWQLQKVSAEKEKLSADTLRLLGGVRLWQ